MASNGIIVYEREITRRREDREIAVVERENVSFTLSLFSVLKHPSKLTFQKHYS